MGINKKLALFVFLGLLVRLLLAPLTYHGDSVDYLNWGKNLHEFGFRNFYFRDTPDAGSPNYPPAFYYLLAANQNLYELTKGSLWFLNTKIGLFPSNFYLWFESDQGNVYFNKLPAIFADLAVGYFIFLFVSDLKGKKAALKALVFYLFAPPVWYLSSLWGQTESLFALPLLASFYALHKEKYIFAPLLFTLSFLLKPIVVFVAPLFLFWWLARVRIKDLIQGTMLTIFIFYLIHIPFSPVATLQWIFDLYRHGIREVLGYLNANAFNLWSFFFGFKPVSDSRLILGIPGNLLGLFLYFGLVIYILFSLSKRAKTVSYLFAASLISFSGFLFLTRVHERYLFLALLFLAPLTFVKKVGKLYWFLSATFMINLYHFWWFPRVPFLVNLFSNPVIEKTIILINLVIFLSLIKIFQRSYAKEN